MSSEEKRLELNAVESSILEYVINLHRGQTNDRRSAFVTLLSHACLIARGAKLSDSVQTHPISILPDGWASNDPIRLTYRIRTAEDAKKAITASGPSEQMLQLSIADADEHVFVSLTNVTTDKFGHLEMSGPAHVRLEATSGSVLQPMEIFPQLESTVYEMEENLWKVVLPKPIKSSSRNVPDPLPHNRPQPSGRLPDNDWIPIVRDLGRNDLDPLGGDEWTRPSGGVGGMVLDPTQALRRPQVPRGGIGGIGGTVPPGARFDPIGPPIRPSRGIGPRGSRFNNPDPDSALPPGWEDMYM